MNGQRLTLLALLVLVCASAGAELIEVNIWKPLAGKSNAGPELFESALQAKAIQSKYGGSVSVARDWHGRMHFAVAHKDYAAWNKHWESLGKDPKQAEFWANANRNPAGELENHYLLDVVASGKSGPVYEVFIWEPMPGKVSQTIESGVQAKAIHEKQGVHVTVAIDRLNRMHYIMNHGSWTAYGEFWETANPEFEKFMTKRNKNPTSKLVQRYTGAEVTPQ